MLNVNEDQVPDYPSTFIKMIKGKANAVSDAKDDRCQVLNPRVIWDGSIDGFKRF
jgi:hypothetical protein